MDVIDFGRRVALEREIQKAIGNELSASSSSSSSSAASASGVQAPNVIFDESDNFIIWATMAGIKSMTTVSFRVSRSEQLS